MEAVMITTENLLNVIEATWQEYKAILDQFDAVLNTPAEVGQWNPRQVLSHVIGSWQRVPLHAGYFLAGMPNVPVMYSDPYWMSEWASAPLASFVATMQVAVEGNKAFVRSLTPEQLGATLFIPDPLPLAGFLIGNYQYHINNQHLPQLRAFLNR